MFCLTFRSSRKNFCRKCENKSKPELRKKILAEFGFLLVASSSRIFGAMQKSIYIRNFCDLAFVHRMEKQKADWGIKTQQ